MQKFKVVASKIKINVRGNKTFEVGTKRLLGLRTTIKGSDRLCKVVELIMQCCGKLLSDSFETY